MANIAAQISTTESGDFVVVKTNTTTGKVSATDTYKAEKPVDEKTIGRIFSAEFKAIESKRVAALSMLVHILKDRRLEGYRGKSNPCTQLSKELKESMRDAEKSYWSGLRDAGVLKIKGTHGENDDSAFQQFCTITRDESSYKNARSWALQYFGYCGALPATDSGFLVPVPVMQAAIGNIKQVPKNDTTIAGILEGVKLTLSDRKENPTGETLNRAWAACREIMATLEGLKREADEMATASRMGLGVKDQAREALTKVAAMQRTDEPALM